MKGRQINDNIFFFRSHFFQEVLIYLNLIAQCTRSISWDQNLSISPNIINQYLETKSPNELVQHFDLIKKYWKSSNPNNFHQDAGKIIASFAYLSKTHPNLVEKITNVINLLVEKNSIEQEDLEAQVTFLYNDACIQYFARDNDDLCVYFLNKFPNIDLNKQAANDYGNVGGTINYYSVFNGNFKTVEYLLNSGKLTYGMNSKIIFQTASSVGGQKKLEEYHLNNLTMLLFTTPKMMEQAIKDINSKDQYGTFFELNKDNFCSLTDWVSDILRGATKILKLPKVHYKTIKIVLSQIKLTQYSNNFECTKNCQKSILKATIKEAAPENVRSSIEKILGSEHETNQLYDSINDSFESFEDIMNAQRDNLGEVVDFS